MGLLDWIFGKKETPPVSDASPGELLERVEVAPGVILPKALATHWNEINKWKVDFIRIEATPGKPLNVQQSSFGYYPCLPKYFPYPVDADDNYMYPLAQINCNELPPLENYPNTGFLQFYISTNDVYGISFDNPRDQSNFRVLYFTNDEVEDFKTDFSFLESAMNSEYKPVNMPHTLKFALKDEYFGMSDARFDEEGMQKLDEVIDRYPSVAKELDDYVWNNFESNGHKIGGYAFFTQTDPRHDEKDDYILLLQIDSDKEIIWGDIGVANFFIRPADLAKKDFTQVLYNWDCT
jgi:uncharacterized protein YwqG